MKDIYQLPRSHGHSTRHNFRTCQYSDPDRGCSRVIAVADDTQQFVRWRQVERIFQTKMIAARSRQMTAQTADAIPQKPAGFGRFWGKDLQSASTPGRHHWLIGWELWGSRRKTQRSLRQSGCYGTVQPFIHQFFRRALADWRFPDLSKPHARTVVVFQTA